MPRGNKGFTANELLRIQEDTSARVKKALSDAAAAPGEEQEAKLLELESLRGQAKKVEVMLQDLAAAPATATKRAAGAGAAGGLTTGRGKKGLPRTAAPQANA